MAIRAYPASPEGAFAAALRRTRRLLDSRRRQAQAVAALPEFRDRYCDLVELICDAAYAGIEPWMRDAYPERAARFRNAYESARPFVDPLLEGDPGDGFEKLFAPETLDALIAADGGELIARLGRTQAALEAWQSALPREEVLR